MLPRLKAEERLNAINDGAIAAGTMEADDQRTVIESLRDEAGLTRPRVAKAQAEDLAGMGIAMTVVEPGAKRAVSDG